MNERERERENGREKKNKCSGAVENAMSRIIRTYEFPFNIYFSPSDVIPSVGAAACFLPHFNGIQKHLWNENEIQSAIIHFHFSISTIFLFSFPSSCKNSSREKLYKFHSINLKCRFMWVSVPLFWACSMWDESFAHWPISQTHKHTKYLI